MFSKEEFIKFIVDGPEATIANAVKKEDAASALPEGFGDFGFDTEEVESPAEVGSSSFAQNLLIASGFGDPEHIERSEVILNTDAAAKHLPDLVYYWPRTDDRPYQTLLFELEQVGTDILKTSLFKPVGKQQLLEDALSRFLQHTLRGFEKGGEKRTASTRQGKQSETLCIVSVQDDRTRENAETALVGFGTKNGDNGSLESFHIREEARLWEPQIRKDHLEKLYDRHFKKLSSDKWQSAFISKEERKLARRLLDTCIAKGTTEQDIEQGVVNLLEEIAGSYGLRRKGGKNGKRLKPFSLPKDHAIGADPESKKDGLNPFNGMTLRDESNRLLGYIIYCLDEKQDAENLRDFLETNNRFHNVLVIYPDGDHAKLELWQGKTVLPGKLVKDGASYSGEGEVVNLLSRFLVVSSAKVGKPLELAEELAFRARYFRQIVLQEINNEKLKNDGPLLELYNYFNQSLAKQTIQEFADNYAQTITYGLLAARWISKNRNERFTSANVVKYLPSTSPFLSKLFSKLISLKISPKLFWLIEDIVSLLDRTYVEKVFVNTDEADGVVKDPVIHFYEDFLDTYDSQIRTERGVYYTPDSVVKNIVESCDRSLRENFSVSWGLADSCTWGEISTKLGLQIPKGVTAESNFVQILDPATGTGTFLKHIIELIFERCMGGWKNDGLSTEQCAEKWITYVRKSLLPRLNAFEIMMAPFIVCHLRIGLLLQETGFVFQKGDKLNVFLTDTLEGDSHISQLALFEDWMAKESEDALSVKQTKHINIVLGNPPYNNKSKNKGAWITNLLSDYKKDLNEKKLNLDDDYVKFWRFAQWILEKNGEWGGVIGFISPHGWLDAPTFRGMRKYFLLEHDCIDVLDLHGNTTKKEKTPSVHIQKLGHDQNVFNIRQGVSISICTSYPLNKYEKESFAKVRWGELWGGRVGKYENLFNSTCSLCEIDPKEDMFLFIQFDNKGTEVYERFTHVKDIYELFGNGIKTDRDSLFVDLDKGELKNRMVKLFSLDDSDDVFKKKYRVKDTSSYKLIDKIENNTFDLNNIIAILYRPFDIHYLYYQVGVTSRPAYKVMSHLLHENTDNYSLIMTRQQSGEEGFSHAWVSGIPFECCAISNRTREINTAFPLFLVSESKEHVNGDRSVFSKPNLLPEFIEKFSSLLGLTFTSGCEGDGLLTTWSAVDLASYVYSILFSPKYRKMYSNVLKRDYPRIPMPLRNSTEMVKELVAYGNVLVLLHLNNESDFLKESLDKDNVEFHFDSNKIVGPGYPKLIDNNVHINQSDYFGSIPLIVWEYRIGGYLPLQKWLKDRKGLKLTETNILQYQKLVAVIKETINIQSKIDVVIDKHGGWPGAFVTDNGVTT